MGKPVDPPKKFALSETDKQSPVFLKLKEHYSERLAMYRRMNDEFNLDKEQTDRLRGKISECKAFLALENPTP